MMQETYEIQWGPQGRDDLLTMRMLGANTVRMYHSIGSESGKSPVPFMDHAAGLSLNLWPGLDNDNLKCDSDFNCYDAYKEAMITGFKQGFNQNGRWHSAVQTLIIMNEPDLKFWADCESPNQNVCRGTAAISAFEGILDAEEEMNVAGNVNLTITWSFAAKDSIDGKVKNAPGYFGFQDMLAITADPTLVSYTPKGSVDRLTAAYRQRWINAVNIQGPFDYTYNMISAVYQPYSGAPWIIGEYGGNGETSANIETYVESMDSKAKDNTDPFAGAAFFQFQTANEKSGSELNFGMFSLGQDLIGYTGEICGQGGCLNKLPVMCLSSTNPNLPSDMSQRAGAVASAWGGKVFSKGMCNESKAETSSMAIV
jgi:hypothetical protein